MKKFQIPQSNRRQQINVTSLRFVHILYQMFSGGPPMKSNCSNLCFLSALACQLAECMDEKELEVLAIDLTTLGDMLASLLAHQSVCKND